ncbi:MAG TPA: hypothetical protein P5268_03465 [Candidatus Marinimicrobia bacterium]|nr:hypothetical protein [Candidatus Neomarinimicrobiota bacterium]HRS52340.1 hypothetical protein [Candidatus Neomarinimicrobiota bacterium]HRU92078.1 hypothetical protein [Candidatus Neomarinimicrobiota bacterium]
MATQIGLQWNVTRQPITPFLGIGLNANWFGILDANAISDTMLTINNLGKHFEAGAFVSGGIRLKFKPVIVDVQVRYAMDNLFTGKVRENGMENLYLGLNLIYSK